MKSAETVINPGVITWAEKSLKERKDLRDDYRNFIELLLIFMRVTPPRGIHFMTPGLMHHVRWMSILLYLLVKSIDASSAVQTYRQRK